MILTKTVLYNPSQNHSLARATESVFLTGRTAKYGDMGMQAIFLSFRKHALTTGVMHLRFFSRL